MTNTIISITEGYRIMTSSECLSRLQGTSGSDSKFGMLYTWAKQGVIRGKAFREVLEEMIERRAEVKAKGMVRDIVNEVEEPEEIVENGVA